MENENKVEQKTISDTKYKYLDRIIVLNGFYKGRDGAVIDYDIEQTPIMVGTVQTTMPTIIYQVKLTDRFKTMERFVWFRETDIKKG